MRLDRCDSCSNVVERSQLVRMRRKYLQPAGSNVITYSEYGSAGTGWTASSDTTTAYRSCGMDPDGRYVSYTDNNTASTHNGIMVFQALHDASADPYIYSAAVTHSEAFYYRVSACIGKYEIDHVQTEHISGPTTEAGNLTAYLGTYSSGFSALSGAWTIPSMLQIWYVNTSKKDAGSVNWALSVKRPSSEHFYFWFEHFQVESSTSTPFTGPPKVFIKTNGTAVTYSTDTVKQVVAKVCPECRERVVEDWEYHGIPRSEPDEAIPSDI